MNLSELIKYAWVKKWITEIYSKESDVPDELLLEWLKNKYDYVRIHSDEELMKFMALSPEDILNWLEEAVEFVWEARVKGRRK